MQKSSFSSSPSFTTPTPPPPLPPKPPTSQTTNTTQHLYQYHSSRPLSTSSTRVTPAIIPLDYSYQTMSPSASTTHHHQHEISQPSSIAIDLDNQYSSLFGDPVPPPQINDYFDSAFETLRTSASLDLGSSEEDAFGAAVTFNNNGRLFSNVPFSVANRTNSCGRRSSIASSSMNFDVLPTALPRLQPPDIQVLPNSSGGSSSEQQTSPNFELLAPEDILTKPDLYDQSEAGEDVSRLEESYTICDAKGRRDYISETTRRGITQEDYKTTMSPSSKMQQAPMTRQCSNESYSSTEWFRPASKHFPEFSRIPKLRPSSKNIMSIKRDEMPPSPLATMLQDSNGSSSGGEERIMNTTQVLTQPTVSLDALAPVRPPAPSVESICAMETDLILSPSQYLHRNAIESQGLNNETSPPPALSPPTDTHTPLEMERIASSLSPAIIKDSIATGGDYRVEQTRLHKKSSFTIISERSPQSSRAHSPSPHRSPKKQAPHSTTSSTSPHSKPLAKPRHHLQRKSLSSTQVKLPQISSPLMQDDSPRPSVQFNMTGRYSPSKIIPKKSILQQRDSLTSSQDTYTPTVSRRPSSTMTTTLPQIAMPYGQKIRSCETLPMITDPYRSAIPRMHRSTFDLSVSGRESAVFPPGALPRPLKPNPNPTRKQRGLLRVINHEEILSRIPPPSNWASMDDLELEKERKPSLDSFNLSTRRRSSSTSPERRSSTQTASDRRSSNLSTVTTSDFSFRRPSTTLPTNTQAQTKRRKSLYPMPSPTAKRRQSMTFTDSNRSPVNRGSRTKISKPTTLSPIIGTPNKDSSTPQSPETLLQSGQQLGSDTPSDLTSRRGSISRIPVRHRTDSRMSSHQSSRTSSPLKDFAAQLPLSGRTSRATSSRSPSRATLRSSSDPTSHQQVTSRANSRAAESRSTSRASTRPMSRGPPSRGPSRASTRSNSRLDHPETANSRANSRLSVRSSLRSSSVSPAMARGSRGTTPNRRKSISQSPKGKQANILRKTSMSPTSKLGRRSTSRERAKNITIERRNSRSRIPMRNGKDSPTKSSPTSKPSISKSSKTSKLPVSASGAAKTATRRSPSGKQTTSAKKTPTSVRKADSNVKRTTSSVKKQAPADKKQSSNLKRDTSTRQSGIGRKTQVNGSGRKTPISGSGRKTPVNESGRKTPVNGTGRKTPVNKSGRKTPVGGTAVGAVSKPLKRNASQQSIKNSSSPTATENPPSEATNQGKIEANALSGSLPVAEQVSAAVLHAAEVVPAVTSEAAKAATPKGVGIKRHGSNMSTLVRMSSRLSLMSTGKKRTDSAQSRKQREPALQEMPDATETSASPLTQVAGEAAASILEKSQKTLETIQKTVTEATDEIHKTINENLTDLKTLESDMGLASDSATSPATSVSTVVAAKPSEAASRTAAADGKTSLKAPPEAGTMPQKSPVPPSQPIEASVSVLNVAGGNEAAERNYELDVGAATSTAVNEAAADGTTAALSSEGGVTGDGDFKVDATKRRSPDGQGGSTAGSGKTGSQEFLEPKEDPEDTPPAGCCRCCTKLCMPCRRSRCSRCCMRRNNKTTKDEELPVLSASSSATTATNVEIVDETKAKTKTSCWQKLNCCQKKQHEADTMASVGGESETLSAKSQTKMETTHEVTTPTAGGLPRQTKMGLCLSKVFCCRSVNKVDPTTGDETEVKKCCFCIPCRRKRGPHGSAVGTLSAGSSAAWQDPERGITATDASVVEGTEGAMEREGCCKRFWSKLLCCRKRQPRATDARRQSIRAPPTTENTRRKLHVDLVEFSSQMKGAIPVLPLCLAWFCAICNVVFPGLGTLLSGIFCICIGIPRFSHYDSARARIGSFIINTIVAVSQFCCVLFCFVGWGWSIWWGTIMIRCAKKLSKIRKVEKLEMEEEQRQAEAEAAAVAAAAATAAAARNAHHVEPEPTKS